VPKLYTDEPALQGKTIEIIPLKVSPTGIWYRVSVGNIQNKEEALRMLSQLKEKGLLPSFRLA
jgi:cell division protein FtsN